MSAAISASAEDLVLMQRVALTRLRRFERLASVADESQSPLWQRLAGQAAAAALRDCLLLGLDPAVDGRVGRPGGSVDQRRGRTRRGGPARPVGVGSR